MLRACSVASRNGSDGSGIDRSRLRGRTKGRYAAFIVPFVLLVVVALLALFYLYHRPQRGYPYEVSYVVLQFGNINGDKHPDLITYGHKGMVAGNPVWHAGRGNRFAGFRGRTSFDQTEDHEFHDHAQFAARVLDLDADGDLDLISGHGIFENRSGRFTPSRRAGPASLAEASVFDDQEAFDCFCFIVGSAGMGWTDLTTFDLYAYDMTQDGYPEIILIGDEASHDDYLILGVSQGRLRWEFVLFKGLKGVTIEPLQGRDARFTLMGVDFATMGGRRHDLDRVVAEEEKMATARAELVRFLKRQEISFRQTRAVRPVVEGCSVSGRDRLEYQWLDFDGDGERELAVCGRTAKHDSEGHPKEGQPVGNVAVYRELPDRFELLSSFTTKTYRSRRHIVFRPPFCLYQFLDFDRDGRLDLLAPDNCIYRQKEGLDFECAREIDLPENDWAGMPATLYAYDINCDEWPDVVSSFQPYHNIELGPLLK